jgi:hypothetical protein
VVIGPRERLKSRHVQTIQLVSAAIMPRVAGILGVCLATVVLGGGFAGGVSAQVPVKTAQASWKFDEFGSIGHYDLDASFGDMLQQQKDAVRYVVVYSGEDATPGAWRRIAQEQIDVLKKFDVEESRLSRLRMN